MNRAFADLHLRVNTKDPQAAQRIIERAAFFGYKKISLTSNGLLDDAQIIVLKAASAKVGMEFILRVDFKPRDQEDLMRFLRKFRRKAEVICVICDNKEVSRQAAKDRRVDLLNFPSLDYHKRFFDRSEAELASSGLAALEVDIRSLLVLEGPPRVRLLSSLRREISIAREFHIPVVVSSGVSESMLMRMPRNMASLSYLFGLGESEALDAVSTNPNAIIERNREKLDSKFVAPGIRIVKEAKHQ
jgi:ribonuclease P/MRP protein subunit RPP1